MIVLNAKYGCLTVLDDGTEYTQTEAYKDYIEERDAIVVKKTSSKSVADRAAKQRIIESKPSSSFASDLENPNPDIDAIYNSFVEHQDYWANQRLAQISEKLETHYKCRCKCGKIHYYTEQTIESCPKYCFYPVPISTRHTYSVKASNATYRKKQKYAGLECVELMDSSECVPDDKYCDYYNRYKEKQLAKKEEELNITVANLPRIYAKNYDVDYTGTQYESMLVEECTNDHLESVPTYGFTQQHHKVWHKITVYKQYRCRCILCGKEQLVTCDQFGVYPPTDYGYHAYYGYWSEISCDCHPISSFQWIVNKLLLDNKVPYQVECSFPDLCGVSGKELRFDFAVFDQQGAVRWLIECQGEQHYAPVEEFGGQSQYNIQVRNDQLKVNYAKTHGIPLLTISYKDKKYEKVESILKENSII